MLGAPLAHYSRALPENSFIHVSKFESAEQLARYLHELDRSDSLYNNYFQWKGTGQFVEDPNKDFCRICALLHYNKVLLSFFFGNNLYFHSLLLDLIIICPHLQLQCEHCGQQNFSQ